MNKQTHTWESDVKLYFGNSFNYGTHCQYYLFLYATPHACARRTQEALDKQTMVLLEARVRKMHMKQPILKMHIEKSTNTKHTFLEISEERSEGEPWPVVKLLPCDQEVTSLSHGNSLLQKCRERLRTIDPNGSDPSPNPLQGEAHAPGCPFSKERG